MNKLAPAMICLALACVGCSEDKGSGGGSDADTDTDTGEGGLIWGHTYFMEELLPDALVTAYDQSSNEVVGTTSSDGEGYYEIPVAAGTYHLRLDEPWRLSVADGVCVVRAPPIRPKCS